MHDNHDELEDLLERAAADDGERLPYWDPKPDEILAGTLEYFTEGDTAHGTRRIAVINRQSDHERISVWLNRSVLRGEFDRVNPQPGDGVVIKFFGEKQPKNPNKSAYYGYRVWKTSNRMVSNPLTPPPAASTPLAAQPAEAPPVRERSDDDIPF